WWRSTAGCPTSCRSGSSCTARSTRARCRRCRFRRASATTCSTTDSALGGTRSTWCASSRGHAVSGMSARTRELVGLIPVSLLVTAGFTAVLITRSSEINNATVTYGAFFLGCCVFAHLFIRGRLPDADPYLFPLAALLAAFGLVM